MERIKLFILDRFEADQTEIIDMLSNVDYIELAGVAGSCENAIEKLKQKNADVILIGSEVEEDGYQVAERIIDTFPEAAVVMIESSFVEDTIYKAIFLGVKDVILRPFSASKLVNVIYRSHQQIQKKPQVHRETISVAKSKQDQGKVISVFSTKGGVGRTFIAANLAVSISKVTKKKVVLVDLDLDFGDTALALNVAPKYTISDIVDDIRNIDPDLIESYLVPHESGIKVLPANTRPQITEFINAEHIGLILKTLQSAYDYIIIDMPDRFYKNIHPAFTASDILLMVTTPEISTIRNIKASLQTLSDLNYSKAKVRVLLNKSDKKMDIKPKDIENTLKVNLVASIEADYRLVPSSLNQGTPMVTKFPKSSVSKDIMNLADKLVNEPKRA